MRDTRLDLSVSELGANELSVGGLGSIDLSITELESVATPDLSSFLQSVSASAAVSSLIIAT
ncbi:MULTISPECIES: hypothetical protein [Amycolatopsis]|uniref:Uncharacterized protein n=2 Tax=Amycolatopsis TaxID=1813 RepID=A0A1I4DHF5_9PSEU|nr:hypothetical protein [Amycolatopsis sacchari]SFK92319.1 hypothetical protein SAMN05421835_14617 [Amycolatopsis sacchari]